MRALFFIIFLAAISHCFSEFQMRNISNIEPAQQFEYAQKINETGQLNQYERKF